MEDKVVYEQRTPIIGCGCFSLMIAILLFVFACTWLINSCNRNSLWEGGVETVRDYYETADSVWHKMK